VPQDPQATRRRRDERIRTAALAVATALVAVLARAVPAYATTTKTNGPFTMHIVGTKLHVDYAAWRVATGASEP